MRYGNYYRRSEIEAKALQVMPEWDAWLDAQMDPGNYDSYKVKDKSVLPYIDGQPQWVTDTYMPPEIEDKLPADLRAKSYEYNL